MQHIPQNPTEEAQQLGFPSQLFGFTPEQKEYWTEPGLPWLTPAQTKRQPLDYHNQPGIWCFAEFDTDAMAPRFPRGAWVNTAPVFERAQLVVGNVYTYRYLNQATGEYEAQAARLVAIGGNYLEMAQDNRPAPVLWHLGDNERERFWNVRAVTHYLAYPAL